MRKCDWEDLAGKRLLSAEHTSIGVTLKFQDGTVAEFETTADCCSRSWIESFEAPDDIGGATLTAVEADEMPKSRFWTEGDKWNGELVQVYQTIFRTDRGRIYVEYRNESNGYYGGSLERVRT